MITIGLPVYNQNKILPIALEGLCRQQEAGEWELIVSSEDNVWDIMDSYADRLREAGCVNFVYHKIKFWIPLPMKWQKIGRLMDKASIGMMLQAADCYSHPDRIKQSRQAMLGGYDWYQEGVGCFYDVTNKKMSLYNHPAYYRPAQKSALNMCMAARHAKRLPLSHKTSSIDRLLFESIKTKKVYQTNQVHAGVDLHGKNNISVNRGALIENDTKPFVPTNKAIYEIGLPNDVVIEIQKTKQ